MFGRPEGADLSAVLRAIVDFFDIESDDLAIEFTIHEFKLKADFGAAAGLRRGVGAIGLQFPTRGCFDGFRVVGKQTDVGSQPIEPAKRRAELLVGIISRSDDVAWIIFCGTRWACLVLIRYRGDADLIIAHP